MPSFCVVESCKLVKQSGDDSSFHKFPINNKEILKKWLEFLMESDSSKEKKPKKISKYSSICSRHFLPSDFSQSQTRKFLKKIAVPSIVKPLLNQQHEPEEPVEVQMEGDPLSSDVCNLCASSSHQLTLVYDDHISLIRKCLPFSINSNHMQKLCTDCIKSMNAISSFLDKVISAQHVLANSNYDQEEVNIKRRIKVEPISTYEGESKAPTIHVVDFSRQSHNQTNQKKCEILEIVDIKPFNFDATLQQEFDDEDDIQILSPKQLKVELTDPDEDGSNELELIRNYIHISTVFLQDHNYVKDEAEKVGVKTEHDDDDDFLVGQSTSIKICNICHKNFKTIRKYLFHKNVVHRLKKITRRNRTKQRKNSRIRKVCAKIIKRKKLQQKVVQLAKNNKKKVVQKRSYSCPTCQKIFSGSKNLYQHKLSHSSNSYHCKICDKRFKRPHGLKQHIQSIHEKEKKHVCSICNYGYYLLADMVKCRHSKLKKFTK